MTDKDIVQALRCTSTPGGPTGDCEKCPDWKTEQLTAEQKEKLGVDTWTSCDVDKVGMDAADLIERLTAENAALREKQRWIPVTERLPKKQAWYHVAIRDKKTMRIAVEQDLYAVETAKKFGHEIGFCKANRWPEREELIAWMQFPSAPEAPEGGGKHE